MNNVQLMEFYLDSGIDTMMEEVPLDHFHQSNEIQNSVIAPSKAVAPDTKLTDTKTNSASSSKPQIQSLKPSESVMMAEQLASSASNLSELKEKLYAFEGCSLKKTAMNTVMYDGNEQAPIMVIGEAPGADEDRQAIPFCGASGKLLDLMFASIGLARTDNLYITNTIFWRPPGNRRPTVEETQICRPFLERQIELLQPQLLILVGATSLNAVLDITKSISSSRGKFYTYEHKNCKLSIPSTPIFHPSYLLRAPIQKKKAWFDLLKIKDFIQNKMPDVYL
ncbi:MAG: uracil-DNA glycosylase [Rickettsiales bacterium]|nr:uracil-DNA glycosylase [Rickettsiales bacterium]